MVIVIISRANFRSFAFVIRPFTLCFTPNHNENKQSYPVTLTRNTRFAHHITANMKKA